MRDRSENIDLTLEEIRGVTAFAVACARRSLAVFESAQPDDDRPRSAIEAAAAFASGGPRTKEIRDAAWAAHRAAQETRDAGLATAGAAARAAGDACGAAYLHPLANATQVRHLLGSAAFAALATDGDLEPARDLATSMNDGVVVDVLRRYPPAPSAHGEVGALIKVLDLMLRADGV